MKILIDMDSILVDTLPSWLKRIEEKTGIKSTVDDVKVWMFTQLPPFNNVAPEEILGILNEPGFNENLPPMPGGVAAVNQLIADGHEVYLVTARHGPVGMPETLKWVHQHLPMMNERHIIFCHDKYLLSADIIIDDKLETLLKYQQVHPNAATMCIGYPYNEEFITKAHSSALSFRVAYQHGSTDMWANLLLAIEQFVRADELARGVDLTGMEWNGNDWPDLPF